MATKTEENEKDKIEVKSPPGTFSFNWMHRTFKREVAVGLLIFWCIITGRIFWGFDVATITAIAGVYATASTMVGTFALAAFGFDAYAKQVANPNPTEAAKAG